LFTISGEMVNMNYKVITYRNPKDFKFGSWRYSHQTDGGTEISGILKSTGNVSKYQKIYRDK